MMIGKWMMILGICLMAVQVRAAEEAKPAAKPAATPAAGALKTPLEKRSYAIGTDMARGIQSLTAKGIEIDVDMLIKGLKDSMAGKSLMTEDETKNLFVELNQELQKKQAELNAKQMEANKAAAPENKKKGEEFLAKNKTEKGVVTLPSGLQYKIIKAGTGPKPKLTDTVVCNYRGTLINGKQFDTNTSFPFAVSGVIPGWTEALQLMPVGSKWMLYIPANLAYGESGQGPIGPNETLIFDIELLAIQ